MQTTLSRLPFETKVNSMKLLGLPVFLLLTFWSVLTFGDNPTKDAWADQRREILVHLELLDLLSISSVEQSFTASLYFELSWLDPSLRHEGPGSLQMSLDDIWNPKVQLLNQQSVQYTFAPLAEVYPDGTVVHRQRVFGTFTQPLDLGKFPFDRQKIKIVLVPAGFAPEVVSLVVDDSSGVESEFTLPDWSLLDSEVRSEVITIGQADIPLSSAVIEAEVKRHSGYFVVKIIFPLTLIVLMSWTIFWINPIHIGPQISVSVTAMLTLIAFRFSMISMLPPLSMLTRLDWFVHYLTFLVFFGLLESVYTTGLASSGQVEKALRVDRIAKWLFPVMFILAILASFVFAN